ncbi:hypothetical protein F511_47288 [Dorcoceras hygrometricum]|uniref:Uncharacterized protein n=1 Tax=Dorcoceras hygrometricum TaxID=472368 RepID=A0A2Z6ZRC2_9LAMI|nr:hypothetical protein F511_47288 [Dorcoceras hygrometricum]
MSCVRWIVPEGVALVSCENMQVGLDVRKEEKSWNQQRRRQHICWRKLKSVTLTLAYLLKESGEIEKTIRYAYVGSRMDSFAYVEFNQLLNC